MSRSASDCGFERHHIVPRALGGSNAKDNIVPLTPREHFVAHLLLAKIHGGKMWFAVVRMKGRGESSRSYEIARRKISDSLRKSNPMHDSEVVSLRRGELHHMKTLAHRKRAREQQLNNNSMGSDAARKKSSESHKGKSSSRKDAKLTEDQIKRHSAFMKGRQHTKDRTWTIDSSSRLKVSAKIATIWAKRLGRPFSELKEIKS